VALHKEAGMQSIRDRYALLTSREREVMAPVVTGLLNNLTQPWKGDSYPKVQLRLHPAYINLSCKSKLQMRSFIRASDKGLPLIADQTVKADSTLVRLTVARAQLPQVRAMFRRSR
jgi:hypothetical protein